MDNDQKLTPAKTSRKGLIIGMIVFGLVLIIAILAYSTLAPHSSRSVNLQETTSSSSATDPQTGQVPDFSIENAEGALVSIRDFEGKPTVLNFWASTCGPCQSEMPHFQAAYEAYGDQANFVMVDIPGFNGETVTRATRFLNSNGYTFPAYFDSEGEATYAFGLSFIPRTYFIDAKGNIVTTGNGALSESALQQGLKALGIS